MESTTWRKSSHSSGGTSGECVELASLGSEVGIRDSKNPDAPHLTVSREGLALLVAAVKGGQAEL
ncbi:DUF397 domain-containing protein [Spirillospora sp. CA-294931]|uniref:DUF397 domain-containing protein n=1 Tax=Spirillospora sp. CA-294931 TaxID=3240042 RepID=UPI003D938B10